MSIKILRNEQGNCINFEGSSNPTYWNACLSGEVDSSDSNAVNVVNDVITSETGITEYEFYRIPYTEFIDKDGNGFADAQEAADYITSQANVIGLGGGGTDLTGVTVCFKLDDTSTSIMLDNGYSYGVNTLKAISTGDGLITLKSELGDITHFTKLDHTNVCNGEGNAISGGLNDVINYLNELFTVGAFESVVISDPYSTMIADVSGVDTNVSYVGYGLDPVGADVYGSTSSNSQNGLLTTETIDQAGEYFTFDIRVEGTIGFGLVHTQASYDAGYYLGNSTYANPTTFGISNSGHSGFQFSHWFHPTPNGSWTNYGANTSASYRSGWYNFTNTQEQTDWLAGNPIKVRVGIDSNSFITIDTLRDGTTWEPHARTSYPIVEGAEFKLGIKTNHTEARVFSLPKVHLLEPEAPTMTFRYIESPDGVFHYPLFTTVEEAEYYDEIHNGLTAGTGSSHTHTYVDDPTNTTWYMPEASHDPTSYQYSVAPAGTETFSGNLIAWTEVTSLTNSDLTPSQFNGSDITQEEGTNVNIQVTPAGASWTTSVSITPSGSGLVYDNYSVIQGTLTDVGADTVYTVTVTRANSYGSSVGTFTITATDVAPIQTNDTAWTKALDFSGSSEYLKHNTWINANKMPLSIEAGLYISNNSNPLYTSNSTSGRPWATTIVFKADGSNSRQTIWNSGEGFFSSSDNFGLEIDSNDTLWFYWSNGVNSTSSANRCYVQIGIDTSKWYGVYIAHKGGRFSSANATKANLGEAFDIRVMSSADSFASISPNRSASNSGGNWQQTGRRMDKTVNGRYTIGGSTTGTQSFYGKVASSVITTLKNNSLAPVEAEIKTMITDPIKWENDYKQGSTYRKANLNSTESVPSAVSTTYNYATQIHLMGDSVGIYPYSHSDAYPNIFNNLRWVTATRMEMQNMVSNDIETVNINGLT
jgi:hypothetical protein